MIDFGSDRASAAVISGESWATEPRRGVFKIGQQLSGDNAVGQWGFWTCTVYIRANVETDERVLHDNHDGMALLGLIDHRGTYVPILADKRTYIG